MCTKTFKQLYMETLARWESLYKSNKFPISTFNTLSTVNNEMLSFFIIIFNVLIAGSVVVKRNDLQYDNKNFEQLTHDNPLLAAYIFSTTFGIDPKQQQTSFNHPDHLPLNPYLVLLLSHYGRYLGTFNNRYKGLYGYNAANNYHNNKPFGSYKIHEDTDQ